MVYGFVCVIVGVVGCFVFILMWLFGKNVVVIVLKKC